MKSKKNITLVELRKLARRGWPDVKIREVLVDGEWSIDVYNGNGLFTNQIILVWNLDKQVARRMLAAALKAAL